MTIELKCFGESGHSYKAALGLELSGLDWTPVFVDFFNGQSRSEDFRALNLMGEAPILIDGKTVLTQSGVILQYIADKSRKFSGNTEDKYEILRWVLWDNHKLSAQIGPARFMKHFLPKDKRPQAAIDYLTGRLSSAYVTLEAHLKGRDWMVGNGITAADLSCCGYLYYPEPFGFERKEFPHIDAWLTRISNLPGWKHPYDLMPGNPSDRA